MAKSPGNRRAVSSCSKALSGLRLHLPTRRPVSPVLVFERRPPCLSHPPTASQPSSCCAACCTAHRPLSRDLSQPRLILPYLLALPCHACLPACLTCLLFVQTSAQTPGVGSRKYPSTRHAWVGGRFRVHVYLRGGIVPFGALSALDLSRWRERRRSRVIDWLISWLIDWSSYR
jgi:hypothetical protein